MFERAVGAVDRHMAHATSGLGSGLLADHLIVREQRPVEQHDVGAGKPGMQRRGNRGGPGHEGESALSRANLDADADPGFAADLRRVALDVERRLARHREHFRFDAARQAERRARAHGNSRYQARSQHAENRIGVDQPEGLGGSMERKLLALAQRQQPGDLVDFAPGQHHGLDRAAPQRSPRVQCRRAIELGFQVRCGVQDRPLLAVGRNGNAGLGSRPHSRVARPGQATHVTSTIPLRITAARTGAENDRGQVPAAQSSRKGLLRTRPADSR